MNQRTSGIPKPKRTDSWVNVAGPAGCETGEHVALGAETQRLKMGEQWCALSGGAGIPGSLEIGFCPEKKLRTSNLGSPQSQTHGFLRAGGAQASNPQTGLASSEVPGSWGGAPLALSVL